MKELTVENRALTLNEVVVQMIENNCEIAELTHTVGDYEVQLVLEITQFKKCNEILYIKENDNADKN